MSRSTRALLRSPSPSFVNAISTHPEKESIDYLLAQKQHEGFVRLLNSLGANTTVLSPVNAFPDSCFTADVAMSFRHHALLAQLATATRRGEEALIEQDLAAEVESVRKVADPARFEGGDILLLHNRIIVGLSERTNEGGLEEVRRFVSGFGVPTVAAEVPRGTLHLQTGVSALPDGSVLGREELVSQPAFHGVETIIARDGERAACNVVCIGKNVVMAAESAATRPHIEKRGFIVHETPLSEFIKADAGPSCLTLFV